MNLELLKYYSQLVHRRVVAVASDDTDIDGVPLLMLDNGWVVRVYADAEHNAAGSLEITDGIFGPDIRSHMKKLTSAEYARRQGMTCPYCRSTGQVEGVGGIDITDIVVTQKVRCLTCKAHWYDVYKLKGYMEAK